MEHSHKIIKILDSWKSTYANEYLTDMEMDCPVQPRKMVVTTHELKEGEIFDPHFSNENVIARFQPNQSGWESGLFFVGE